MTSYYIDIDLQAYTITYLINVSFQKEISQLYRYWYTFAKTGSAQLQAFL